MKIKIHPLLCALSISIMLSACGGGKGSALENTRNDLNGTTSSSTTVTTNSSGGAVDTISPEKIGFGEGINFVKDLIGSNKPAGDLSAGGTVVLTVNVVSVTNTLVTTPVEITFNSPCLATGESILKSGTELTNKVIASNGSASIAYTANGCIGNDNITASASIAGKVANARLTLPIASDDVQSIKFVDTQPNQISLSGTGGVETSVVRFQVLGRTGAPIKDVTVGFELNTPIGGLKLTNNLSKTDIFGYASTTVQAGNIHTSVRVTATDVTSGIFTTSSQLIVSTGIPDQDSMSLAATATHPIGWDIDGVESTLTVRLSDAFNNPPPENTNVAFRTEGGSIIDGCQTNADGSCSVKWTSTNPRPTRNAPDNFANPTLLTERKLCVNSDGSWVTDLRACILERAGRVTVLATAVGNESFIDTNGNGVFEAGDIFKTALDGGDCNPNVPILSGETPPNSSDKPCDDLSEAYLDKDESGAHENDEEFVDFTSLGAEAVPDKVYTIGNGKYNGVLCLVEGATCTRSQVTIRRDMTLVMTTRHPISRNGTLPFIKMLPYLDGDRLSYNTSFLLGDENGHGIGAGTTLSIDTTLLTGGNADVSSKGPILASSNPVWIGAGVGIADPLIPPSGSFNIKIKTTTLIGDITTSQIVSVTPTVLVGGLALSSSTLGMSGSFKINDYTIDLLSSDDLSSIISKINAKSPVSRVTASNGGGDIGKIMLLSTNNSINIEAGTLPTITTGSRVIITGLGLMPKIYYSNIATQYPLEP